MKSKTFVKIISFIVFSLLFGLNNFQDNVPSILLIQSVAFLNNCMLSINQSILEFSVFGDFRYLINSAVSIIIVLKEIHNREAFNILLVSKDLNVFSDHFPNNLLSFGIIEFLINKNRTYQSFKNIT